MADETVKKYPINPVAKPRMTQRDKWQKRPVVQRYWDYKDQVRLHSVKVPVSGAHVLFTLPMPKSWSKQKREIMRGQPHQQKPDVDNLIKGLLDAVYGDDSVVWDIRQTKVWGDTGQISVRGWSDDTYTGENRD